MCAVRSSGCGSTKPSGPTNPLGRLASVRAPHARHPSSHPACSIQGGGPLASRRRRHSIRGGTIDEHPPVSQLSFPAFPRLWCGGGQLVVTRLVCSLEFVPVVVCCSRLPKAVKATVIRRAEEIGQPPLPAHLPAHNDGRALGLILDCGRCARGGHVELHVHTPRYSAHLLFTSCFVAVSLARVVFPRN